MGLLAKENNDLKLNKHLEKITADLYEIGIQGLKELNKNLWVKKILQRWEERQFCGIAEE